MLSWNISRSCWGTLVGESTRCIKAAVDSILDELSLAGPLPPITLRHCDPLELSAWLSRRLG